MAKKGFDILLKVKESVGTAKIVGGQRNATLNRGKETIETTNKTTGGWKTFLPGLKEWSVDADGVYVLDGEGYDLLEKAYNEDTPIIIELGEQGSGYIDFTGEAILTDFPIECPYDDACTYSITLQGTGALSPISPVALAMSESAEVKTKK